MIIGVTLYDVSFKSVKIENFTNSWSNGLAFCALIHHFFPQVTRGETLYICNKIFQAFDFEKLSKENRKHNFELAFQTGE